MKNDAIGPTKVETAYVEGKEATEKCYAGKKL